MKGLFIIGEIIAGIGLFIFLMWVTIKKIKRLDKKSKNPYLDHGD